MTHPLRIAALLLPLALLAGSKAQAEGNTVTPPARHDPAALQRSFGRPVLTAQSLLSASPIPPGQTDLVGEPISAVTNGWGPIEKNRSNGEQAASDGKPLTLNGVTYAKGFGTHANSSLTFNIAGQCTAITASVGVDDEVGDRGSVQFQVYLDGTKVYDSGVISGKDPARAVSVPATGKKELRLVVTNGGDNLDYDHADWVNPVCVTVFGPPLVITKGGIYSGAYESTVPTQSAITVKTAEPVIIENATLRGRGFLISGWGVNLTVRNVEGETLLPNVSGWSKGRAINVEEVRSLTAENNSFTGGGIYVRKWLGDPAKGESIRILRNVFTNIDGRRSDGNGGLSGGVEFRQAVQFNDVTRIPGAEIAWNQVTNTPGASAVEDNINLFLSSGTPQSPILIHDNYIQGAYPVPASGENFSGGGIMLGDGKASDPLTNGYTRAYDNIIVGTSNYGLAIAGGSGIQAWGNRIVGSGRLPDGSRIPSQNVGLYVWDMHGAGGQTPPAFGGHTFRDNAAGWTKVYPDTKTSQNPMWLPDCGRLGTTCTNNSALGPQTLDSERAEWIRWQQKLTAAGVTVGAR